MMTSGSEFQPGDLVEDVSPGEEWNVDDYSPATPCHPARVGLGRDTRDGVVVTDRSADQIRLVTRAAERAIFPGDGWSDHVFLRQTGQTVAEFTDALGRQFGTPRHRSQPRRKPKPGRETWMLPGAEDADVGGVHDADGESGISGGVVGEVRGCVDTVPDRRRARDADSCLRAGGSREWRWRLSRARAW